MADSGQRPTELPVVGQRPRARRDAAENRARILSAARGLLAQRGAAGVSMDAVAAASEVGKGTVFRHFTSRLGLMEAIIDDHVRGLQDDFLFGPPPLGPGAPAAERLEAFVIELVRRRLNDIEFVIAAEGGPQGPPSAAFGSLLLHATNLLHEIDPEIHGEVVGAMILSAVSPPLLFRMQNHLQVDVDALETAARRLLRGVIPR